MISCIVLVAGKGSRMKSGIPKVLHLFQNKHLLHHILDTAYGAGIRDLVLVVGYKRELIMNSAKFWYESLEDSSDVDMKFAIQEEQLGTGHAVSVAKFFIRDDSKYICVLPGDVPSVLPQTILDAFETSHKNLANVVVTTNLSNPFGYGRIIRSVGERIFEIVEQKDASALQKQIKEVNTGIFIFMKKTLFQYISDLQNQNSQHEYYLTDMVSVLQKNNSIFLVHYVDDYKQFLGVNSLEDLKVLVETNAEYHTL